MSTTHADPKLHGYSATELQACAQRELGKRRRVYPRLVAELKITQQLADREMGMMAAIS